MGQFSSFCSYSSTTVSDIVCVPLPLLFNPTHLCIKPPRFAGAPPAGVCAHVCAALSGILAKDLCLSDMCRFTRVLLGFTTAVLWLRHAACFTAVRPSTRNNHPVGRVRPPQGHHVFFNSGRRRGCCWRASSSARAGTAAVTKLRISEEDRESLKLERDLERDAQIWVNGDPGKQKLWDKAKAWRKLNQSEGRVSNIKYHPPLRLAAEGVVSLSLCSLLVSAVFSLQPRTESVVQRYTYGCAMHR